MQNVESIEARLNALEASQKPKRLLTAATSIIALIISVVSGGITFYDRTVAEPRAAKERQYATFSQSLDTLANLHASFGERYARVSDPVERAAVSQGVATQVQTQLISTERLLEGVEEYVTPLQLLMLAQANFNTSDLRDAVRYSEAALARDPGKRLAALKRGVQSVSASLSPLERAAILRQKAMAITQLDGPTALKEVRALLDEGDETIGGLTEAGASLHRAEHLFTRLTIEWAIGDCIQVEPIYQRFARMRDAADVNPDTRPAWAARLRALAAANPRCSLPNDAASYVASIGRGSVPLPADMALSPPSSP